MAERGAERAPLYCGLAPQPPPQIRPDLNPARARAIVVGRTKWVNGTVLHFHFFDREDDGETVRLADGSTRFVSWVGAEPQREAVREAFRHWEGLGIGLRFAEVADRGEAEVRIGFMEGDGSWSYVGRDVLQAGADQRTMNFGWDLTTPYGGTTALHEIGHTIGMPHEHQNPYAGIVWDEPRVYETLGGPPNNWPRETTYHNILRKLAPQEVDGSEWDPDSIMHYGFPAGLILEPERYRTEDLTPPGTLSPLDRLWAREWYPPIEDVPELLEPFHARPLALSPFEQADFRIEPPDTRTYSIATFGATDTVLVLFEEIDGEPRFVAGDDDGGEERNARIEAKLFRGRRYLVRMRLFFAAASGQTAVMCW